MSLRALPIDSSISKIVESLEQHSSLVLKAAPGSGKTTRVPPALLNAPFCKEREILVLEPRRLAAKYSARRVAQELGEEPGKTVGYQFRFENVSSASTRLRFLTEGMLMRRLMSDPRLEKTGVVILDEFHERHLHTDIALAYLRHLQRTTRPELRILVMSATLDTPKISEYLGGAPILEVANRPFDVSIIYSSGTATPHDKPLELRVRDTVARALETASDDGDVLVFLPGMGEILRATSTLEDYFRNEPEAPRILPLHGELSREEQERALSKSDRTKVILATNVAETSLTIEGVTTVIDSGLARIASYSSWSGVPALRTRPISRASAIQRAGRAGRTAPGRCFRLFTQGEFDSRPPFETPEILRADLTQTLLELKNLGLQGFNDIRWFETPSQTSVDASEKLLYRLGAATEVGLTEVGRAMSRIPAHPRLARFLIEASRRGCLDEASTLAAVISESRYSTLDVLDTLRAPLGDSQRKLKKLFSQALENGPQPRADKSAENSLRFSLLTGFPDRVARRREAASHSNRTRGGETELVFSSGGSAKIEESALILSSEYFVVLDLKETQQTWQNQGAIRIHSLTPIDPDWLLELEPSALRDQEDYYWDAKRERVMNRSALKYDEIVLDQKEKPASPGPAPSRLLMKHILGLEPSLSDRELSAQEWIAALSKVAEPESIERTFARMILLQTHLGKTHSFKTLFSLFESRSSLQEFKNLDWPAEILSAVMPDQLGQIDQLLPEFVTLPSGRRTRIHYSTEKAPWIESRLQDFFGWTAGPALLQGRIPLTLHLLAPNQRAIQVTTDLKGFWERGYQEQRNALSRRYPRHPWPENPLAILKDPPKRS